MIDWTKPIETVDGYPARVISEDYFTQDGSKARIVQVDYPPTLTQPKCSQVFAIDEHGRCPVGYLRRVKNRTVKREGWILRDPVLPLWATKEDASRCAHSGYIPCYITWEEPA